MLLFLDTETNGKLDFEALPGETHQPDIVQLAAMLCDPATRRVVHQINYIIAPEGWRIGEDTEKVHGISHAFAICHGVSRRVALASFNNLAKHATALVAHNIAFDGPVLETSYFREDMDQTILRRTHRICTMQAATPVLKLPKPFKPRYARPGDEWKWPTLTECYSYFFEGRTFDGAHNAMNDVIALAEVYWKLAEGGHIALAA